MSALSARNAERGIEDDFEVLEGHAWVSSVALAARFGKRHGDVLRSITDLECSDAFKAENFREGYRRIDGPRGAQRAERMIYLSRDGFVFVAMGFTGAEAARFKEAYISAFNRMEDALRNPEAPRVTVQEHTRRVTTSRSTAIKMEKLVERMEQASGLKAGETFEEQMKHHGIGPHGRYLVATGQGKIRQVIDLKDDCMINGSNKGSVMTFLNEFVSWEFFPDCAFHKNGTAVSLIDGQRFR